MKRLIACPVEGEEDIDIFSIVEVYMKYCSTCGKELQDDMQFCPSCGTPLQMSADEPKLDETFFAEEPTPKKKHKGIFVIIIVLVILAGAAFLYSNVATVNTYNKFAELYNTMAEGAGKAETANILITDVWRNSIFQTADTETDKYTKANGGNGQFYDDFNDALASLYADEGFIEDLAEIYSLQSDAETLIKDLAKHPNSFDEEYSDFKDCYNLFVKFTDMALTGEGSLNSFTDDHNELDKKIAGKLKELDIYFD